MKICMLVIDLAENVLSTDEFVQRKKVSYALMWHSFNELRSENGSPSIADITYHNYSVANTQGLPRPRVS